jgi:hypothetical protein
VLFAWSRAETGEPGIGNNGHFNLPEARLTGIGNRISIPDCFFAHLPLSGNNYNLLAEVAG